MVTTFLSTCAVCSYVHVIYDASPIITRDDHYPLVVHTKHIAKVNIDYSSCVCNELVVFLQVINT